MVCSLGPLCFHFDRSRKRIKYSDDNFSQKVSSTVSVFFQIIASFFSGSKRLSSSHSSAESKFKDIVPCGIRKSMGLKGSGASLSPETCEIGR
ncbi:unnamed protein product [Meloidogyne enterolobii]|uniref:Uncharacterized protein n=1 Tax=Meloidogyne enterolobii TaxID=390850 RepID=A0ACB0YLN2_MELEN